MRRSRTEQLILVTAEGKRVELATESRDPGDVTTQDIFQVSPDGAFLAYASKHTLHVRAADGNERTIGNYEVQSLMRFSPDGKHLIAVTGNSPQTVVLFKLSDGTSRELGTFIRVIQLEWMRDGVVVNAANSSRDRHVLVHLPLEGKHSTLLVRNNIERFVAAATGTRVIAFARDDGWGSVRVLAFDVATPTQTRELAVVTDWITNAAASYDGSRVAFTTHNGLFESSDDAPAKVISKLENIHSLWFSSDGRLGFASSSRAVVIDGTKSHRFDGKGPINMLRFEPVSGQALVSTAGHAWDAVAKREVARAFKKDSLLGADRFASGFVLWTKT